MRNFLEKLSGHLSQLVKMPIDFILVETDQACPTAPGCVALERGALLSFLWAAVAAALGGHLTLLLSWQLGDFSRPQLQTVLSFFNGELRVWTVLIGHLMSMLLVALLLLLLSELSVLLLSISTALACTQVLRLADWPTPWLLSRTRR